jgi:hypothetical protein
VKVGEDRGQPCGHSAVVVGVAAPAEREVDRPVEGLQGFEVEVALVERVDQGAQPRGPLGHPRRGWPLGSRRRLDTWRQLQAHEPSHELVGRKRVERVKPLPDRLLGRRPLVPGPSRFQQRQTQQSFAVDSCECE